MTVNGRNPSTNPHLSSWITDIINRRYSSISPVFPIQRWGAGLFPSLSVDLMTFTKLPYACVYTHTHTQSDVFLSVCFCMCVLFVQHFYKLDAVYLYSSNIVDQFGLSELFGFPQWSLLLLLIFSFFAVIRVGHHAAPQPSTEGQCSSLRQLWTGRENEIKVWINQENQHTWRRGKDWIMFNDVIWRGVCYIITNDKSVF